MWFGLGRGLSVLETSKEPIRQHPFMITIIYTEYVAISAFTGVQIESASMCTKYTNYLTLFNGDNI